MASKLNRNTKIFISGVVLVLAVVIFFSVLLLKESPRGERLLKGSAKPSSSEQEGKSVADTVLQDATYSKVIFNGKTHSVNSGDLVVDSKGTLFVKTDYVSSKLGMPIKWEKDTIWIGLQPSEESQDGTKEVGQFLSDMEHLRFYKLAEKDMDEMKLFKNYWSDDSYFTVAGKEYQKGIGMLLGYPYNYNREKDISVFLDYNVEGNYKKFKANIGIDDKYKDSPKRYILRVHGDGEKKFESKEFQGGDFAFPIEVDISGVKRLSIEIIPVLVENDNLDKFDTKIVIANAQVLR